MTLKEALSFSLFVSTPAVLFLLAGEKTLAMSWTLGCVTGTCVSRIGLFRSPD